MSRPEHEAPPEIFYNDTEARKYTSNSRMMEIQAKMTDRCIELLNLPDRPCYLLDIGCGSGLSGESITEAGHMWAGIDISPAMLQVAREREVEGDVFLWDMGHGLSFRPGCFDGAISVSALQWLCNQDKTENVPQRRLRKFFQTLYNCLSKGSRAVFQFYPESPKQIEMVTAAAMRCGFSGGLVVDYPNSTKAKKFYLCLFAGTPSDVPQLPRGLTGDEEVSGSEDEGEKVGQVAYGGRGDRSRAPKGKKQRDGVKSRDWILAKKERQRKQGREVRPDSKYTGRSRGPHF